MKKIILILISSFALACGNSSERTAKDQTDENVSPNQTQTEEEAQRKDSTSGSVTQTDTVSVDPENPSN